MYRGQIQASKQRQEIVDVGAHLVIVALGDVFVRTSVASAVRNRSVLRGKHVELRKPRAKVAVAPTNKHDILAPAPLQVGEAGTIHRDGFYSRNRKVSHVISSIGSGFRARLTRMDAAWWRGLVSRS